MNKTEPSPREPLVPAPPDALPAGRQRSAGSPWLLAAHISFVATLLPLLVRLLPLKLLLRLLTPPAWFVPYRRTAPSIIAERVALRLREPRLMQRRACLRHGLTLFHFLRLAGAPAVLRIGVFPPPPQAQRLHAHCWVTLQEACWSPPPAVPAATLLVWDGASAHDPRSAAVPAAAATKPLLPRNSTGGSSPTGAAAAGTAALRGGSSKIRP